MPSALVSDTKIHCKICRRQFSKYTCPNCNLTYCSLTCFNSQIHSQCSEIFCRKELEIGISAEPGKSKEEKEHMLQVLKRIEAEGNQYDSDPDESEDLMSRLGQLDLDSSNSDEIWTCLTPAEQARFQHALQNPKSFLRDQILAVSTTEETKSPWWEDVLSNSEWPRIIWEIVDGRLLQETNSKHCLRLPSDSYGSIKYKYNVVCICIAYAYVNRNLGRASLQSIRKGDPDIIEARRMITSLLPFLLEKQSKTMHQSLLDAVTSTWSYFDMDQVDAKFMSVLLTDAARLVDPVKLTVISSSPSVQVEALTTHPHIKPLLMLADIADLYDGEVKHLPMKLIFYAAQLFLVTPPVLSALSRELLEMSRAIKEENVASGISKRQNIDFEFDVETNKGSKLN